MGGYPIALSVEGFSIEVEPDDNDKVEAISFRSANGGIDEIGVEIKVLGRATKVKTVVAL